MHKQFVTFSSSPLGAQWLLRLHRVLLWLETEVLNVNAKTIIKPFQEALGQSVLLFVWGQGEKGDWWGKILPNWILFIYIPVLFIRNT